MKYFRRNWLFALCVLLCCGELQCQLREIRLDSLRRKLTYDSLWIYRPRAVYPLGAVDQRNSFLRISHNVNSPVNIWGAKAGITLYDRHNIGIGGYSVQSSSQRLIVRDNSILDQKLTFQYLTIFYEYSFIETKRWEIGIPIEAGFGFYKTINFNQTSQKFLPTRYGNVYPLGTALDVYFKPVRWVGINAMGGYRYVINNTSRLNLNGWFYSVGLAVYIRQIVQDTKFYFKKKEYRRQVDKANSLPY